MESHTLNLPPWALDISQELMFRVRRDGAIVAINPACAKVLGYGEPELDAQSFFDLVHPDDLQSTRNAISSTIAGANRAFDNRFRHRDGTYRSIGWVATGSGPDVYVAGVDFTAENNALKRLRRSTRTELLGQLTRGIVHDFNNSLQNIIAGLELVRKLITAGRGAEAERFIANAVGSAQRAAQLNERLLGFADDKRLSGVRTMSFNELMTDMEDMVRRAMPPAVKLVFELEPNLWDAHCDVADAQAVALDLVIRARDAIADGGTITIKTCNSDGRGVVSENGPGMPPGDCTCLAITHTRTSLPAQRTGERIPQRNAANSTSLSMAAHFARQYGGHAIRIEGKGGVTVSICLPRYPSAKT